MINVSDLKPGVTFQLDGNLYVVLDYSHNKTARAAANIKVKMKNLRTGSTTELTFGGNDKVKRAQIDKKEMQYLYSDGELYYFMDQETFEQIPLNYEKVEEAIKFLKENMFAIIKFYKGEAFSVEAPNFVELLITQCDPSVKGNTATNAMKPATLETGAQVNVPMFVNEGDTIRVDTRTGEYMERV